MDLVHEAITKGPGALTRPVATSRAGSKRMSFLNNKSSLTVCIVSIGAAFLGGAPTSAHSSAPATATVFATGLVNPRGLEFGPDGKLYVAEGGFPVPPTMGAPPGLGGPCSAGAGGPGEYFG